MHIQGVFNISMSTRAFEFRAHELCRQQCKIVTYCNGQSCDKSKTAAKRLYNAGFTNVYAYVDGIKSWVNQFPEKTVLLNRQPADLAKLITDEKLSAHLLPHEQFFALEEDDKSVLVDVRDNFQHESKSSNPYEITIQGARKIPLGRFKQTITCIRCCG